jgi:hypothetical protein
MIFQMIAMVVMFVLGCIAMRRWMQEHRPATLQYEGLHPTDEQLLAWAEELTGLFVDCRDKGYGIAWEDHVAYFYKIFDGVTVVYGTWDYENGMKPVERVKYAKSKPHPTQKSLYRSNEPQYPPEFGYENHPDW